MKKDVIVYADGGSRGNGKIDSVGGWGVFLSCEGNERTLKGGDYGVTNNQMEMLACIKALETINNKNNFNITIYTDSAYVCNCINQKWYEKWRNNGWLNSKKKPVENKEMWERLIKLVEETDNLEILKVKGHSGVEGNEIADRLVNEGMDELISNKETQPEKGDEPLKDEDTLKYDKLVRDNIVDTIEESGKQCVVKTLTTKKEKIEYLNKKLQEEVLEYS